MAEASAEAGVAETAEGDSEDAAAVTGAAALAAAVEEALGVGTEMTTAEVLVDAAVDAEVALAATEMTGEAEDSVAAVAAALGADEVAEIAAALEDAIGMAEEVASAEDEAGPCEGAAAEEITATGPTNNPCPPLTDCLTCIEIDKFRRSLCMLDDDEENKPKCAKGPIYLSTCIPREGPISVRVKNFSDPLLLHYVYSALRLSFTVSTTTTTTTTTVAAVKMSPS